MIQVDLKSRKSIYEQIVDGFKELISCGVLKQDDKLPSVRELSKSLTVNPNTVQKAYRQLDSEGWIYSSSGLGCFVNGAVNSADPKKTGELYSAVSEIINQLRYLGVSDSEMIARITSIINERGMKL